VRLQGVGASSVIVNAAKYPTQKLDIWRPRINALFSVDPITGNLVGTPQVDALPGQEITGGVVLMEPSVLGTEEGAGITVLAKNLPASQCANGGLSTNGTDITVSNFLCAPSRIDGVSVTGGDAGGGVSICTGSDGYSVDHNWVCGNFSTSDGAGIGHIGFSQGGSITKNAILFNQTFFQ